MPFEPKPVGETALGGRFCCAMADFVIPKMHAKGPGRKEIGAVDRRIEHLFNIGHGNRVKPVAAQNMFLKPVTPDQCSQRFGAKAERVNDFETVAFGI